MTERPDSGMHTIRMLVFALLLVACALASIAAHTCQRAEAPHEVEQQNEPAAPTEAEPQGEQAATPQVDEARETYVSTWAERIDAFDAGTPLEGYGRTFAEAAYEYGVDPRWSPAIARVESGSGVGCVYECNAWGWGQQSWPDWDTAIYAHVAGLAQGYGSTISWEAAASYNEENPDGWYEEVSASMTAIWPDDSL